MKLMIKCFFLFVVGAAADFASDVAVVSRRRLAKVFNETCKKIGTGAFRTQLCRNATTVERIIISCFDGMPQGEAGTITVVCPTGDYCVDCGVKQICAPSQNSSEVCAWASRTPPMCPAQGVADTFSFTCVSDTSWVDKTESCVDGTLTTFPVEHTCNLVRPYCMDCPGANVCVPSNTTTCADLGLSTTSAGSAYGLHAVWAACRRVLALSLLFW